MNTMKNVVAILLMMTLGLASMAQAQGSKTESNVPDIPIVRINPGSFLMGNDSEGSKFHYTIPVHQVAISYAFEMGKTEITQAQWIAVMGENPSHFDKCGLNCPVENVSWNDVMRFLKRLNKMTGKNYRLPSEAEWEYACRAGERHVFCGGNDAKEVGWTSDNSGMETSEVEGKQPNAWGLYDMTGNVMELVQECAHMNYEGAPSDGSAWESCCAGSETRIVRGGAWNRDTRSDVGIGVSRAAGHSYVLTADQKSTAVGFRVVRTLP